MDRRGLTPLSPKAWAAMEEFDPDFSQGIPHNEAYNFKRDNVLVGKSFHSFLEAFAQTRENGTGSAALDQLVTDLSKQISKINFAAGQAAAMSGIGLSYNDAKTNSNNEMGSHPDATPDRFAQLVMEQLPSSTRSPFSGQTNVRSDVICQTGQGSKEGQVCR